MRCENQLSKKLIAFNCIECLMKMIELLSSCVSKCGMGVIKKMSNDKMTCCFLFTFVIHLRDDL